MFRLIIFFFTFIITSCSTKSKERARHLEIIIEDAQSYKYDLTRMIYTVSRLSKPDTLIHFKLTTKETEKIIDGYYNLELYNLKGKQNIEDDCTIMPKLYTKVKITAGEGLQEITIDEGCNDFKIGFVNEGKKVTQFLKLVRNTIRDKPEIKSAPTSDIMYL